jgi:hypothetical protein
VGFLFVAYNSQAKVKVSDPSSTRWYFNTFLPPLNYNLTRNLRERLSQRFECCGRCLSMGRVLLTCLPAVAEWCSVTVGKKYVVYECVGWVNLAQERIQWRAHVGTLMNLRIA